MRLSDVLSKAPQKEYTQIDGFMENKSLQSGKFREINVGRIALNFYCKKCDDLRTFWSSDKLQCLGINPKIISIDVNLECNCKNNVQVWYLIESENDISGFTPNVRIIKKSIKLSSSVRMSYDYEKVIDIYLERADRAYYEDFGAGSMVYLRIIYEYITRSVAYSEGLIESPEQPLKNFYTLLKNVDGKSSIIPREFSNNGYKLFKELSNIIHGNLDEEKSLQKYPHCRRLIIGILDNVKNSSEIRNAVRSLKWEEVCA